MNLDFEDRGETLYFPGIRWGKYAELPVHARAGDLIAVKVPGHTSYISRGQGNAYSSAEFMVLQVLGASRLGGGFLAAKEVLRIPLKKGS